MGKEGKLLYYGGKEMTEENGFTLVVMEGEDEVEVVTGKNGK